ncbi:glycosyltransferase involved in cell wall biosynthesis [Isoptericola sp. CG 20/1183]|uniref:Glycosyltransferase involved in cell wall biosynthesis n=1 Tax=Isoptericola halotolerans TaxID=300560 RepID=A0ABX5EHC1_9MICO|nr:MULTISPECIES: glycosyltransferase [Isoptericola]PRZ06401.1 glycosyltransferase involved in cell wall biosynthesis [Isoptericola halotolerans]PRZ06793.1 glycosyltransferase involved in cell wall biosynthesis [Isoptericola sp. CG 20/1183]
MRIVHAVRSDGFAGVERHVSRLAAAQAAAGHDVRVVGGATERMAAAVADPSVRLVPAATTADVVRALRAATDADVVHTHMTAAEVAAALAAWTTLPGRFPPVVATRHFARPRGSGPLGGLAAALARRTVRAQLSISEYVAAHVDGASTVVPPGIPGRPDGPVAAQRLPVVLMAQRLEPEKRADVGLEAFASSGLAAGGWQLLVAGDGSRRPALEEQAHRLGLSGSVTFLGERADVDALMSQAALFLAPCPVEGLGLSVLEAMADGLPVVAAGAGGHVELLEGLDPLACYPPQDPTLAGKHLAELAASPERRDAYGRAARQRQHRHFSPAAQASATEAVYRQVLGSARRAGARPQPGTGHDVVVVSLEDWDLVRRRNQHLVTELLRTDPDLRVLFVEPPADPLHQLSRRSRPRAGRGLHRPPAGDPGADRLRLYQPTKLLPRRIDPRADERLARGVRRAARTLGFDAPVLWVNDPAAATLVRSSGWPALYDVTDDWAAAERTPAERARLDADEDLLLSRCVAVTVCSPDLLRTKGGRRRELGGDDALLVTNGVDVARYRTPVARPSDLPDGPVAVYLGTVHPDRFDVPLLVRTARAVAGEATVVVVGPVVDVAPAVRATLRDAGVVLLGPRPWTAVPAYLQHADVLLVPHLVNDFTGSLDPIKLYEYRAVRRPVVATPVAGFRDATDPLVTSSDAAGFPAAVRGVLQGPRPADGGGADDIPTWRDQAARMAGVIDALRRRGATQR